MKTHRADPPHTPAVHEPHFKEIAFSPILRQAELREQREKAELFIAVWMMAQENSHMSAGEALARWESRYGG